MKTRKLFLLFILSFLFPGLLFCQDTTSSGSDKKIPSGKDSTSSFQIITLKDGSVFKGKIIKKEKRTIQFRDDALDTVLFGVKHVYSIEEITSNGYYLVELTNGTIVHGKIISRNEKEIIVETPKLGAVSFAVNKIKTIKCISSEEMHHGEYWFHDPLSTQYFILPSAMPMRRNDSYYRNTDGLLNTFRTAFSNEFSLDGGAFFPIAGFISPHFNYKVAPHLYLGGGGLLTGISGNHYIGGGYGVCTFGTSNGHISVAGLYGSMLNNGGWRITRRYRLKDFGAVSMSGMKRLTAKFAVVSENWVSLPDRGIEFFSCGLRLLGEKSSWEFGWGSVYALGKYFTKNPKYQNRHLLIAQLPFISYVRKL
jgi:hypothetical protein